MESMKERERRSLICLLVKEMRKTDSWAAETHIQKCVYFLQALLNVPVGYEYILYKHGPYSFDLRRELAVMRARFQLDVEPRYPYGPSFTLGARGGLDLNSVTQYESAVRFVATEISTKAVGGLERLSTALYVQVESPDLTVGQAAHRINKLKPHISTTDASEAINEIRRLRKSACEVFDIDQSRKPAK